MSRENAIYTRGLYTTDLELVSCAYVLVAEECQSLKDLPRAFLDYSIRYVSSVGLLFRNTSDDEPYANLHTKSSMFNDKNRIICHVRTIACECSAVLQLLCTCSVCVWCLTLIIHAYVLQHLAIVSLFTFYFPLTVILL